jgi:hypothetical protein
LGRGREVIAGAPHDRKEKLKVTEAYVDSMNDQRISKRLKMSFLYIVIEDTKTYMKKLLPQHNKSEK